jgi:hypothetical protein
MRTESHHDHELIEDRNGTIRWKAHPETEELLLNKINLNNLIYLFHLIGVSKNSDVN